MFAKIKMAAAIALLAVVAAPGTSSAQQEEFLPSQYSMHQEGVPSDAFGSAIAPTRHRGGRHAMPPSNTEVTDDTGNVIGADPDPNVRFDLRRDSHLEQD